MASALSTLERASSERSQAEANCRGCVPCLFQNCGQLFGSCCKNDVALVAVSFFLNLPFIMLCYYRMPSYYIHDTKISLSCPTASPSSALSQPSCDVISKAQKLQVEAERSWALSQACAYYQHRCPPGELDSESCIRIMGESCSARVLQCSLLNTMQNLEPVMQTHAQGEGDTPYITLTHANRLSWCTGLICTPLIFCACWLIWPSVSLYPSSSVWSEVIHSAKHHTAPLQDCRWIPCAAGQLALARQPSGRWRADVRRGSSGQLMGGHCCTLFCWVSAPVSLRE